MKILLLDEEGCGLDFAIRSIEAGHEVQMWRPRGRKTGESCSIGQGIVPRIDEWKPWLNWADLILLTGNSMYRDEFQRLFDQGYPVFGANNKAAEMELDRALGQEVLEEAGIETAPYETFSNLDKALEYVKKEKRGFAIKPWGGTADKALTFVSADPRQIIHTLNDWKAKGLKGELMLQELVEGIEMGVSGWFGPGGWSKWIEEDWEEKKFMNDGLGCNTGEQGTIVRYVRRSKLFDQMLEPLTEHLHSIDYVGNINVNCIIPDRGAPRPLEFTMRLGWPAFCIHMALQRGDPAAWMLDLLHGHDSLDVADSVAVGVVITHGKYPTSGPGLQDIPLYGVSAKTKEHLHFQQIKAGRGPGDDLRDISLPVSAGDYLMVVTGLGETVREAQKKAYETAWEIEAPTNLMFRTDIGDRLKKELPLLQAKGYAKGMEF